MNRYMKTLPAIGASSLLLVGCCTTRQSQWEYKVTMVPSTAEDANKMLRPSLETRQEYLNGLGAEGWVLVSEDGGVYYLKRHRQ
jgi:hypothetical protein